MSGERERFLLILDPLQTEGIQAEEEEEDRECMYVIAGEV